MVKQSVSVGDDLKVLSYNICEGGGDRLPDIAAIIRSQQPDVVALAEANNRAGIEMLAHELAMQMAFGEANGPFHLAWLSRLHIRRQENHRLSALSKTLLEIEIAWEGVLLHLFATHLASRHDVPTPAEEIPIILEVLHPILLAGKPHLLVGDFNALSPGDPVGTPPSGVEKRGEAVDGAPRRAISPILEAGYVDCYRVLHAQEPGYTYPTDPPGTSWLRLDYIFASPQMAARLSGCDVVAGQEAERASDHFPIWAQFH